MKQFQNVVKTHCKVSNFKCKPLPYLIVKVNWFSVILSTFKYGCNNIDLIKRQHVPKDRDFVLIIIICHL